MSMINWIINGIIAAISAVRNESIKAIDCSPTSLLKNVTYRGRALLWVLSEWPIHARPALARYANPAQENTRRSGYFEKNAAITYSRLTTTIGRVGLTSVFGMVTGVAPHVLSPHRGSYRARRERQAQFAANSRKRRHVSRLDRLPGVPKTGA